MIRAGQIVRELLILKLLGLFKIPQSLPILILMFYLELIVLFKEFICHLLFPLLRDLCLRHVLPLRAQIFEKLLVEVVDHLFPLEFLFL